MTGRSTRRGILKGLGAGLALSALSSTTGASSESGTEQSDSSYGILWNDVAELAEHSGVPRPKGGKGLDIAASNGGYALSGQIHYTDRSKDNRALIRKVDTNGIEVFEQVLGEKGYELNAVTSVENGYVCAGHANRDGWIAYIDEYGQKRWSERIGRDSYDATLSEAISVDEGILLAGTLQEADDDYRGWAVKIDRTGTRRWEQRLRPGTQVGRHEFDAVAPTADGGCLLAGYGRKEGSAGLSWGVRLTAGGEPRWNRIYGVEADIGAERYVGDVEEIYAATPTEDGGFLMVGRSRAAVESGWAALVIKIAGDGSIDWTRTVDDHRILQANAVTETTAGEYLIVGRTGATTAHLWTLTLNQDGTVISKETYLGSNTERGHAVVSAPGGAAIGGFSFSRGRSGWANPWIARLHAAGTATPDGFDPRIHGFGFGNWAGTTGVGSSGEPFQFPYVENSADDAAEWVFGLSDPVARSEDLWDGGKDLIEGLYQRQISTDGHCLGMVLAAEYYYRAPEKLPDQRQFAQSVPRPSGKFSAVGERIRSEQDSFGHGGTATQVVLALNAPFLKPAPSLGQIRQSLSNEGTAPVALKLEDGEAGSKATDEKGGRLYHSGLIYEWQETDEAIELYYYDPDDPAEMYKSPDQIYGTELEEEKSHLDQAFENPRYTLRVDPDTGELLGNTHARGLSVVEYAYFPVGGGAAVQKTFERATGRGRINTPQATQTDESEFGNHSEQSDSSAVEIEYLDRDSGEESPTQPTVALPSLVESAVVATLDVPGSVTLRTPDGRTHEPIASDHVNREVTDYAELVWALDVEPGEIRLKIEPEADDYTLRLRANDPSAGRLDQRIDESVGERGTHEIKAQFPDSGTGSAEVVPQETPDSDGNSDQSAATVSTPEDLNASGSEFTLYGLGMLGIAALVAYGYLQVETQE